MKFPPMKPGRRPVEERTRLPEDTPSYAVDYYVRLGATAALHEGNYSPKDIADIIGGDAKNIANHLRYLYEAGCIEFVGYEGEGNLKKTVYRAIERPIIDDETYRLMSFKERHDLNGVAFQWIMAEGLASYRSGNMSEDDDLCLISDEPDLDPQGRAELREFLTACWSGEPMEVLEVQKGVREIAARAANRMAESGETGTKVVVALLAFERGRSKLTDRPPFLINET